MPNHTNETTTHREGWIDVVPATDLTPTNNIQFVTVSVLIGVVCFMFFFYMLKKPQKKKEEPQENGLYFSGERKMKLMIDTLEGLEREVINLKHENRMKSDMIDVLTSKLNALIKTMSDGLELRESIVTTNVENRESILALSKKFEDIKEILIGKHESIKN